MSASYSPATDKYDRANEQAFRERVAIDMRGTLKANQAITRFLMQDSVDSKVYVITLESGVLTATAL